MRLWTENNLAFIHIPKTGGTTIRSYLTVELGAPLYAHQGTVGHTYLRNCPVDLDGYNIFCCVRDPIARAMSYYRWFRASSDYVEYPDKKLALKYSFHDWLDVWFFPHCPPQHEYVTVDSQIDPRVKVLRKESLQEDLFTFLIECKVETKAVSLPRLNCTDGHKYQIDTKTKNKILSKEHWASSFYQDRK